MAYAAAVVCALTAVLFVTAIASATTAQTLTVTNTSDTNDSSCTSTTCSLYDAIAQANADNAGDTIIFASGVTGTITLTSALPAITGSMTIQGPTSGAGITISGNNAYSVFTISSGTINISNLTIANGSATDGAGILDNETGTLTVTNSTFLGNSASTYGGAIALMYSGAILKVTNSTFAGNKSELGGAIMLNVATATVINSTFSGNTGSSGADSIYNAGGTLTLQNSILSDGSNECNAGCSNGTNGNVVSTSVNLLPLENYGGTTPTMLPLPGSPAICAGLSTDVPSGVTKDQRGFALSPSTCSSGVDAGAVQTNYATVTNANDSGSGSLRSVITLANSATMADVDATGANGTVTLASSLPAITGQVNIVGPGANHLAVSGGGSLTVGPVLTVNSGANALFYGLTIEDGMTDGPGGGGIYSNGTLIVMNSAVVNNAIPPLSGSGGGIFSGGYLLLLNSTVSGNSDPGGTGSGDGGGIFNNQGTLVLINSTVSGNTSNYGGGIYGNLGTLTLTNSTVSGNSASGTDGGISYNATLTNSIVEGNSASSYPDIHGSVTDLGGNRFNTSSSGTTVSPNLAALGNYSGTTGIQLQTMLPEPGSAAICAGIKSAAVDQYGLPLSTDERGASFGVSSYCTAGQVDAGAVQSNYQSVQFTNGSNGYGVIVNTADVTPAPVVSVTENGQNVGGVPITLVFTPTSGTPTVTSLGPVTTVAGTGATFSSITGGSTAGSGTLSATLSLPVAMTTASPGPELDVETTFLVTPAAGTLTSGTVGGAYNLQFGTTGGKAPFTYSVTTGNASLPAGLTLTANSGVLSGTATAGGTSTFTIQSKDHHGFTGSTNYTLTINPTAPAVSVNQPTLAYGASGTIAITLTGPAGVATPTGSVSYTIDGGSSQNATFSGGVASLALPATLNPGSHSIVWNYSGDTNYTLLSSQTIAQTVSAAVLTIKVNSFSRAYGAANPTLTGTVTGLLNGDTAATVGLTYSTTATSSSAAGSYSITASITSPNYSLNVTQGTLTVTAASLAVTVNSLSRVYGAANPTLTGSVSGLQPGDSATSIGLTYSTTATPNSPVGTYSITPSITSSNYSLNVTAGNLTVTAAPLTVAVNSSSRLYGAANPSFSGTVTGLQNSDSASSIGLTYSTAATAGASAGTYPITASITSGNYSLSVTAGVLTVTSAPLSVTVDNSTRGYGVANPTFTGTPSGLVNGDTASTIGLTYSTAATTSSPVGTYPITATITSANYTLSVTPGTLTIGKTGSGVAVSSLTGPSAVNQSVTFSASIAPSAGTGAPTGSVTFTDATTGSSLCTATVSNGQAACVTASLRAGSNQQIQAAYSGDSNYNAGSGSVTQTVSPASSSVAVTSSLDPSVVLNPQNSSDTVNLMAAVSPSSGVPLSGSVTFTDNGAPIAECQAAVAVNPATGVASCITKSLVAGTHTILAVYNGDPNYGSSKGSVTQQVQDYSLTTSTTSEITVSQGYTNTSDPFSPQSVTVNAAPISGFTGNLALSCTVVAETVPSGAVPPTCSLGSATLAIGSGATSQAIALTIDAGSGSNSRATPGTYSVSVTGVDSATGLMRISASVPVLVRSLAGPLTLVSGATTGNTVPVSFTLPANVGLSSLECVSASGPTLTSSVAPIALGMSCAFNPDSVPATGTIQGATITVAITTGGVTTAMLGGSDNAIFAASMVGLPILLLLGLMPGGKKSRKVLCRYLGLACMVVLLLQGTGCGGGHFTAPPSTSGTTPPGSYNILVQGKGTDNQTYQAVIQLNVTR